MPFYPYDRRAWHTLVLGKTGQGKTSLLADFAWKDMRSDEGAVIVIDPKGGKNGLAEILSRYIPEKCLDDVIWIDMEHPVPLDFMSYDPNEEGDKERVLEDLKYILSRGTIADAAVQLKNNVGNLLETLLDVNEHHPWLFNPLSEEEPCTILDVHDFFDDPARQQFIIDHITIPRLARAWTKGRDGKFPNNEAQNRILTRVAPFMRSGAMKKILGDPRPRLNMKQVLEKKKIILASLPIKHPAARDYGALIVSKIQHAAFSRGDIFEDERTPYFLYIDEFRKFQASENFADMLTMARSFRLCLTLADVGFELIDGEVKKALKYIDNYIVLKVDSGDASFFAPMLDSKNLRGKLERDIEEAYDRWAEAGCPTEDDTRFEYRNLIGLYNRTDDESPRAVRLARKLDQLDEDWIARGRPHTHPLKARLDRLEARRQQIPWTITPDDLHDLGKFQAIYVLSDQEPVKEPLNEAPPLHPTKEQEEKLAYLIKHTQEHYGPRPRVIRTDDLVAEISTNRNPQSASLHSTTIPQNEGDDDIFGPEPKDHGHSRKGPASIR